MNTLTRVDAQNLTAFLAAYAFDGYLEEVGNKTTMTADSRPISGVFYMSKKPNFKDVVEFECLDCGHRIDRFMVLMGRVFTCPDCGDLFMYCPVCGSQAVPVNDASSSTPGK